MQDKILILLCTICVAALMYIVYDSLDLRYQALYRWDGKEGELIGIMDYKYQDLLSPTPENFVLAKGDWSWVGPTCRNINNKLKC
jgi:hypothetical protein